MTRATDAIVDAAVRAFRRQNPMRWPCLCIGCRITIEQNYRIILRALQDQEMTETRDETETEQLGAQMADPSNEGKEVAPADPKYAFLSPVMRERAVARDNMLADVDAHRAEIEQFLKPFDGSYDLFRSSLKVFLMRQMQTQPDFFTSVSAVSFMEAILRIAMNGLIADGKEAAIAAYKGVATAMFMRDGFVKVLWRTGLIRSINDGTVTRAEYEGGRFEYDEGDDGYLKHRPSMDRRDEDEIVAAYCVIQMAGGGVMREVVPKYELEKIRKMSKSPARRDWASQMDRKAAIRRIMGKMPREKAIAQLLEHDEAAYELGAIQVPENRGTGLAARLAAAGDVSKPGFAPGHAEAQVNPLSEDAVGQQLAGAERGMTEALDKAVSAYIGRLEAATTPVKLDSIRAANQRLLDELKLADPERAQAVANTFTNLREALEAL